MCIETLLEGSIVNEHQKSLALMVEKHRELIFAAERYIWAHPETGYREWKTDAYLSEAFEKLGYTLVKAGNIPGFYTDIDTGIPGPKVLILGELDALYCENHPESVDGVVHACGHNAQCAALLGVAAALKEEGALDGLCGSVRLMAVPAEELIEIEYRQKLKEQGIIKYLGGKVEFMHRGFFDGCDIAFMLHTTGTTEIPFSGLSGNNGCIAKKITYKGKAAHAGGSPHMGINALYAANLGINAANALRETFIDEEHVRFHPIITKGGDVVNTIPDECTVESFLRGKTIDSIKRNNEKINRALAGAALSMGAQVHLEDISGYAPLINDPVLLDCAEKVMIDIVGKDCVRINRGATSKGSTDMGDVSCVMPAIHPYAAGAVGLGHGANYFIRDPEKACVNAAKFYILMAYELLKDNGEQAKDILAKHDYLYPSIRAYLEETDRLNMSKDAVIYGEDGKITVDYKN